MRYSDSTIDKVREANDIVEVVGRYVKLSRSGSRYKGLCPFHNEKTPSFVVTPDLQIFKCFGCGKGGNVFTFIQEYEKVDFITAVEMLADSAHIDIVPENGGDRLRHEQAAKVFEINKAAARFYYINLRTDQKAIDYVRRRGLSASTVHDYGIGSAPDAWDALYTHLRSLDFLDEDIFRSKLCLRGREDKQPYDAFRGRLIFPILDVKGRVIAFGGRVYDNSVPKYINSPETVVYTKGVHLYGLNVAKSEASKGLILVEGYMDCVSLCQAGIRNVVASLGTALTEKQARLIAGRTNRVYIGYDADGAGQNAIEKAIGIFRKTDIEIRVLIIPGSKDPDEYIKANGAEAFRVLLDNAITDVDFLIRRLELRFTPEATPQNKGAFLRELTGVLAAVPSETEREMYARRCGQKYLVNYETLIRDSSRKKSPGADLPAADVAVTPGGDELTLQYLLLAVVCADNSCFDGQKDMGPELFTDKVAQALFIEAESRFRGQGEVSLAGLLQDLPPETVSAITDAACRIQEYDSMSGAARDIVTRLRIRNMTAEMDGCSERLKDPGLGSDDKQKLKTKIASLAMAIAAARRSL